MFRIIFLAVFLALFVQCTTDTGFQKQKALISEAVGNGKFSTATDLISNTLKNQELDQEQVRWLTARQAMIDRIRLDFSKTEEQIRLQLARYFPVLSDNQLVSWENSGHIEMRKIDGVKKYFKNAVSNLYRLDSAAARVRQAVIGIPVDPLDSICIENTTAIIRDNQPGKLVESRRITIEYSITVDADAVPSGEIVSCWMPFPRESSPRQQNVKLIDSDPAQMVQSGKNSIHSSLFSTKKAVAGQPVVFSYTASFEISGQWFDLMYLKSTRGLSPTSEFSPCLREELPHVSFSPKVRHLSDSLAVGQSDPFQKIRSFYYWIDQNIPWASALEYSTFECIPDYVISQGHGDCGMKTFLLMSMARYKGIPARWQSGWMLHPGEENLHDWCEIWFEPTGWIPVDMSFGLQNSPERAVRDFYLSGIDSYRMIVNDGFAGEFDPPKKFYRSEPFDFQRGEVEWSKGNLYFNQWDYHLKVLSIEPVTITNTQNEHRNEQ
ncbi:MAG: transglutaminase-like domain-containing protein [Bacteroidales bacterium]|jgi:hypothetical protein